MEVTNQSNQESKKKSQVERYPGILEKPSIVILNSRKGSGKTTALVNLLCDRRGWKGLYDRIFIFSPTFKTQYDILWKRISSEGVIVFENLSEPALMTIYTEQMACPETKTLLISDDCDEQWRKSIDQQLVNRIMTNSRHLNLSLCFLSQRMMMLPPSIRSQLDCLCVWAASSYTELDSIHKEFSCLPKREFLEIFHQVTSQSYHFLALVTMKGKIKMYDCLIKEIDDGRDSSGPH
jgi:hypothetical protein